MHTTTYGVAVSLLLISQQCNPPATAHGPLVIEHGGTYSGTYTSTSSQTPCVRVRTTEPVVLRGCVLRGPGALVEADDGGADLTIVNCQGQGLPPTADQTAPGRFLHASNPVSIRLEHNYFEHTAGIYIYQWQNSDLPGQTLTVRYNKVREIDGRYRNGGGTTANFLQLNQVHGLNEAEIAWNEVINSPNGSLVEDVINVYNSSGLRRSPLRIHHNYIRGAYPVPATAASFSGSGITTDGDASSVLTATAYVEAYENQIISTCNAAMNIAAGHNNHFHDNRLVTSGLLPDSTRLNATYAATAIFNYYKKPATVFHDNRMTDNTIGYVKWGANSPLPDRYDLSAKACSTCTGTTHLPNPITLQTEAQEWPLWQQRQRQHGVVVGPVEAGRAPVSAKD